MKKLFKLAGIFTLSTLLVACSQSGEASHVNSQNSNNVKVVEVQKDANDEVENNNINENSPDASLEDIEDEQDQETIAALVELTYPSEEYIVSGNEDNKVVTKSVEIEGTDRDFVKKVLSALANDESVEGAESTGIKNYTLRDSYLEDGKAVVDFSSQGLNGGSLEEEVLLRSIVNSLLSVEQINAVEVRVDGEISETLMGHIDISNPFTQKL